MKQSFSIQNGEDLESFQVPEERILDVLTPKSVSASRPPEAIVREGLDNPVDSLPLEVLAKDKSNVVIVTDDITRPTPSAVVLSEIMTRLAVANVPPEAILILIATGTHRPMSAEEAVIKLGSDICSNYRWQSHRYDDLEQLIDLGSTDSGVPVQVNRSVVEADLVIGVGNIVPHRYCGWSGGAKIIQPGISGEPTTAATHLQITKDNHVALGIVENSVRHDIERVAARVGLDFIVNTVLNRDQELIHIAAGNYRTAFRAGVQVARTIYGTPFKERAQVTVASAYPSDINLWQAGKAFYAAEILTKKRGVILLVSPCYEGVGEHGSFPHLLTLPYEDIERAVADGQIDDRISAAAALAVARVKERCDLWLVSRGITSEVAKKMGMRNFGTIQEGVDAAMDLFADPSISILHNATEVLPEFGGSAQDVEIMDV